MDKQIARIILYVSLVLAIIVLIVQAYDAQTGDPHVCTSQYIAATAVFICATASALFISRSSSEIAIFAWCCGAILSVAISGIPYAILDDGDDYPAVLYTLYLVILCSGTVLGFWRTILPTVTACGLLSYVGWLRGRGDQAIPAIFIVLCFFAASSWFNRLFKENADLRRYVDIELDGAEAKLDQWRDSGLG